MTVSSGPGGSRVTAVFGDRAEPAGGQLALISPSPQVAHTLQLSGLDTVIAVHDSAEDASTL